MPTSWPSTPTGSIRSTTIAVGTVVSCVASRCRSALEPGLTEEKIRPRARPPAPAYGVRCAPRPRDALHRDMFGKKFSDRDSPPFSAQCRLVETGGRRHPRRKAAIFHSRSSDLRWRRPKNKLRVRFLLHTAASGPNASPLRVAASGLCGENPSFQVPRGTPGLPRGEASTRATLWVAVALLAVQLQTFLGKVRPVAHPLEALQNPGWRAQRHRIDRRPKGHNCPHPKLSRDLPTTADAHPPYGPDCCWKTAIEDRAPLRRPPRRAQLRCCSAGYGAVS